MCVLYIYASYADAAHCHQPQKLSGFHVLAMVTLMVVTNVFFFIIQLSKQLDLRLTRRRCLDPLIPPNITQFMFEKLFQAKIMHYLDLWGGADFVGSGGDGWK